MQDPLWRPLTETNPLEARPSSAGFSISRHRPGGALRRRLPLDPHGPFGVARVALPSDSLGPHTGPLRPSKARTTLAPRRGTDAARPPATPSAAGCAGAAPGGADAPNADGPRGARPRARAATRWRPLRRHGGRTPSRARTEPRTSPRAGRGAWWRLPCRPLTVSARPRRPSPEQKRRAAGSRGAHARGGADAVRLGGARWATTHPVSVK